MQLIRKHFDTIDSTNTWSKRNVALLSQNDITLVTANTQTDGRGRYKRRWESPPDLNIYATFCFFIDKKRKDICNISQILSLSLATLIENIGLLPQLKWPNDLLIGGKKLGGILAETTEADSQMCFILGVGLNVNMPAEYLRRIDRPATSLKIETGKTFDIEKLITELQQQFLHDLHIFLQQGFLPFHLEYRQRLFANDNRPLRFHAHGNIWEGVLHEINDDGSLDLLLLDGKIKRFMAGEVLF